MLRNPENNGTEEIGLVTPTPGESQPGPRWQLRINIELLGDEAKW